MVSAQTQESLRSLADKIVWALDMTTAAVDRDDKQLAREVIDAKNDINNLAERISDRLVDRLIAEDPHRTSTYRVERQLIENYKRIYYFTKRIAKLVAVHDTASNRNEQPVTAAA